MKELTPKDPSFKTNENALFHYLMIFLECIEFGKKDFFKKFKLTNFLPSLSYVKFQCENFLF